MRHRTACAVPLAWKFGGSDEASGSLFLKAEGRKPNTVKSGYQ